MTRRAGQSRRTQARSRRDAGAARAAAARHAHQPQVLIGAAAVVLFFISAIVLVALKPPSLRLGERPELFNVEHKPITDGLSKLPASYDGVRPDKKAEGTKSCRRACRS